MHQLDPTLPNTVVRLLDRLGKDACFTEDGHEIRVACPTGDDVHMDMVRHPCASRLADVRPQVEGMRMIDFSQDNNCLGYQLHHFGAGINVQ